MHQQQRLFYLIHAQLFSFFQLQKLSCGTSSQLGDRRTVEKSRYISFRFSACKNCSARSAAAGGRFLTQCILCFNFSIIKIVAHREQLQGLFYLIHDQLFLFFFPRKLQSGTSSWLEDRPTMEKIRLTSFRFSARKNRDARVATTGVLYAGVSR